MATMYLKFGEEFGGEFGEKAPRKARAADPKTALPSEPAASEGPPRSREQRRSRRKRPVRGKTISIGRLARRDLELQMWLYPEAPGVDYERPKTRGECAGGPRPCPFVSCAHHLYLEVNGKTGSIKINFPDIEPGQMKHSCALDVAESDGATLERVGDLLNLTRERVRQIEVEALARVRDSGGAEGLLEHVDSPGPAGKRRLPVLRSVAAEVAARDRGDDCAGDAADAWLASRDAAE
jgi:hypothetical protein